MSNQSYKVAVVQAAPVFMDMDATLDKSIQFIQEAASNGAKLIAFPECWVPGYPWWIWLAAPAMNLKYFQQYHENSITVGSEQFDRLSQAAAANDIFISMGPSERDHGSLYIAQFLIDNNGEVVQTRRKLKPTHMERTVFGEGNGHDLEVYETELGHLGQLSCWEHLQPLSKYAMYSMHEQVHIGAWPSFSCYPQAYALGAELNNSVSRVYAAEGQCYFLAPCAIISQAMIDLLVETPEQADLIKVGGGYARVFGPDGGSLCEPLAPDEEGLLFADIDLGAIAIAKSFADPVGHYSRPDVTRLLLNRANTRPVELLDIEEPQANVQTEEESMALVDENVA